MKWIRLENTTHTRGRLPASYVRRKFSASKEVKSATLKLTALGVYKAYLNGSPLDAQVLLPGYTDYRFRVQYQQYDVTGQIRQTGNELFAVIGDGWYRGSIGIGSKTNCYGEYTQFGCELLLEYADSTRETIEADEQFEVSNDGPLRENDLKIREVYDATRKITGWHPAEPASYDGDVIPQEGEPVLEHEHFQAKVIHTPNGETVLDFGQNLAGYVHFSIECGKAGHRSRLTMGEVLDENGDFTQKNLAAEGASLISGEVGQELVYICREGKQAYQPYFLVSGFRYARVDDWCEEVKPENFTAIAVYSDLPETGSFRCSDEGINRLVENVQWSRKSNFVDIPGDCPTRERAGWTADISIFCETACWLTDPRKFLQKWLADYMLEQGEDGSLPYVVPDGGYSKRQRGGCGWSDAICNIAIILYRFYGDTDHLAFVYDSVKRFVEYQARRARKKNILTRTKNSPFRRYIIEQGFHYGEWLEPDRPMYKDFIRDLFYPDTEFTTAWFYQTTRQLADMAGILGYTEDEDRYRALSERIRSAYAHYFLPGDMVHSDRQCRYVRPIFMGLSSNPEIAAALNRMVIDNGCRIGTGFHTTYKILSVLCDYGYTDTAYKMLENTRQPGWLYEVMKGATTTWENWNGVDESGVPHDSHNHYAPGAVAAWLFGYCAGIRPLQPGFKEILIRPYVGGSLTYAEARYDSVRGTIFSRWEKTGSGYLFLIEIPAGAKARIELPDGSVHTVTSGTYRFECDKVDHHDD